MPVAHMLTLHTGVASSATIAFTIADASSALASSAADAANNGAVLAAKANAAVVRPSHASPAMLLH